MALALEGKLEGAAGGGAGGAAGGAAGGEVGGGLPGPDAVDAELLERYGSREAAQEHFQGLLRENGGDEGAACKQM